MLSISANRIITRRIRMIAAAVLAAGFPTAPSSFAAEA
jgi:hypothetical protein